MDGECPEGPLQWPCAPLCQRGARATANACIGNLRSSPPTRGCCTRPPIRRPQLQHPRLAQFSARPSAKLTASSVAERAAIRWSLCRAELHCLSKPSPRFYWRRGHPCFRALLLQLECPFLTRSGPSRWAGQGCSKASRGRTRKFAIRVPPSSLHSSAALPEMALICHSLAMAGFGCAERGGGGRPLSRHSSAPREGSESISLVLSAHSNSASFTQSSRLQAGACGQCLKAGFRFALSSRHPGSHRLSGWRAKLQSPPRIPRHYEQQC